MTLDASTPVRPDLAIIRHGHQMSDCPMSDCPMSDPRIDRSSGAPAILAVAIGVTVTMAVAHLLSACSHTLPDPAEIELANPAQLQVLEQQLRAAMQAERDPDTLQLLSQVLLRQGAMDEALLLAQEASRRAPFRADLLQALGDVFLVRGERFRAELAYSQAVTADPQRLESYAALGTVQQELGQLATARETLTQALNLEPLFFKARLALVEVLLELGAETEAEEHLQRALTVHPDSRKARLVQVTVLESLGRLDEAARVARTQHQQHPQDAVWTAALLRIEHLRRDWEAVAETWPAITAPGPEQLLIRADLLEAQGEQDAAADLRADLARQFPTNPAVLVAGARGLLAEGKTEEALQRLRTAVENDPEQAEAHYWRAIAHFRLEQNLDGDLALNRAEALAPEHPDVSHLRIRRLLSTRRLDEATRRMTALRKRAPDDPQTRLLDAELQTLTGQWSQAETLLQALPPSQPGLRYARARLYYLQGRYQAALEETKALQAPAVSWQALYLHAAILGRLGRPDEALALITPRLVPNSDADRGSPHGLAQLHRLAGDLHERSGDAAAARAAYTQGLRNFPRDPGLIEGLTRTAAAMGQWQEASEWLEKGVEEPGPHQAALLERLARVYQELGESAKAQTAREQYLDAVDPLLREPSVGISHGMLFGIQQAAALAVETVP